MSINIIFYILCGFTLSFGILVIIGNALFSFKYTAYEKEKNIFFANIQETLNSKLIYEFNPRIKCHDDEEKIILGSWDGTIDKCNCEGEIKDNKCGDSDEVKGCKTIDGEKPKNYTVFGGKEICVKRKGDTHYNLIKSGKIISKDKNCSETDKSCGIVDSFERKLCVNKNENLSYKKR